MRILVFLSVFVLGLFAAEATTVAKDSVDEATAKTEKIKAKADKAEKVKESKKAKAESLKDEADTDKVKKESKKKVAKEAKDKEEKLEKKVSNKVGEPVAKPVPSKAPAASMGAPINVNTASAKELEALNGIGPVKAQAIVEYRKQHGAFKNTDDLINVPGIGDKTAEALKGQVKF